MIQSSKTPNVQPDTIRNICHPSMQIDVQIVYNGKEIDAAAILDSGAEGICWNTSFIRKYGLPTYDLELPMYPRNVNGILNKQGAICHATILRMGIGTRHWENIEVAITNTGQHKILLGTDWLKAHNPSIDWSTNRMRFNHCPPQCHPIELFNPSRKSISQGQMRSNDIKSYRIFYLIWYNYTNESMLL